MKSQEILFITILIHTYQTIFEKHYLLVHLFSSTKISMLLKIMKCNIIEIIWYYIFVVISKKDVLFLLQMSHFEMKGARNI